MAAQTPLVFDAIRGVPRQVAAGEGLRVPGDLQLDGLLGFYGTAPQAKPVVGGSWNQTVDQLITGLAQLGLIQDRRPLNWLNGVSTVAGIGSLGPYEPGRLIIGSVSGWRQLDQPAAVAGVIQVPASHAGAEEINPISGLPMRQLAYSPILSYGPTPPPTTAMQGALWFDSTLMQLRCFTGTTWDAIQPAVVGDLVTALATAPAGAVLTANGSGSLSALTATRGTRGSVLMFNAQQAASAVELITVDRLAPWPDGGSAFGPKPSNGDRPVGLDEAIWCNTTTNAETISFWDETAHKWKGVYVNNPVLNKLAELRGYLVDGDLLTYKNNTVTRLPIGNPGNSLIVDGGELRWHDRFSTGLTAPASALDGDFWLDATTDVLRVRENGRWLDFNEITRYVDTNGSGGAVRPGQVLVHSAPNWQLADSATVEGSLLAIALEDAGPGVRLAGAVGGIVSLSEAQWNAVIDNAEPRAIGSGLSPGRDYFASSTDNGYLSTKPSGGTGLPVGTALSGTHLLLRPGDLRNARQITRVHTSALPPNAAPGELWWNPSSSALEVYLESSGVGQWVPATAAAIGGTTPGGGTSAGGAPVAPGSGAPLVEDLAASDWVGDPLAAAIRVKFSDGSTSALRIRGAGGAVVTMADNHTLVIDAGGGHLAGGGLPLGATNGQFLSWRNGRAVWATASASGGLPAVAAGSLAEGNGVMADPVTNQITGIDEGAF